MPSKSIVNEQRAGLISWDLETPEGRAFLEQLDNQDYLRSALMSYGSTARVGDMLWTVSSGEGSEWVVDIDRMATEDRMRSEEVNLYNYLYMMKDLKEERELEKLTNNIAHCSIMWLEVE